MLNYAKGQVLKSTLKACLFIMVCDDGTVGGSLDQTDTQFRAVVLFDAADVYEVGAVDNAWNKGQWMGSGSEFWEGSNFKEVLEAMEATDNENQ